MNRALRSEIEAISAHNRQELQEMDTHAGRGGQRQIMEWFRRELMRLDEINQQGYAWDHELHRNDRNNPPPGGIN